MTANFRVLRYDTRGHGSSAGGEGPYTLDDLGGDVLALLDHLTLTRVHVCGISLGGLTALWLALHARERILSIMPCNTAARIGKHAGWEERIKHVGEHGLASIADATMARWFTDGFRQHHPAPVEATRAMLCRTNTQAYLGCCAALQRADLIDRLDEIKAPCLAISGTQDQVTPPSDGIFLREHIRGAGYAELDTAHLSNIEAAVDFTNLMGSFLHSVG